ncbi:3-phosphoshikimate 1-carboxyvinyltransferase [Marinigracilibium pacificum]|uniref:3-phosphoshikimate 1-carboxyvinyltransferase n=1 Tax=Marinigracilibium pacificum TaxID=2729599 RepID=A0A848IYP2_9BACT|nr:3-phosphoshikimate 1-carboxyvinyltransferase [Marinigracilibium pacificum]NMM49397.1 3-phosphoshikimate 1-carboxyvinyltransferase [Marinigracilibium pacificum]
MSSLKIEKKKNIDNVEITPVASKSESNRALIIESLAGTTNTILNLSEARDTQTMNKLLNTQEDTLDVIDAGTTMRFLTAFMSIKDKASIMTGTPRMCQRPIGILVEALRSIGADIKYVGEEGYPPLKINAFKGQASDEISIKGDISSQYISALLMIAPVLPNGLKITIKGKLGSKPYVDMTLGLMEVYGVKADWTDNIITIPHQNYKPNQYTIESDWSGASYWFSLVSLADSAQIKLKGLRKNSFQGDHVITSIMKSLGVKSEFTEDGITLTKCDHDDVIHIDFTHCPDLAQTVAVVCAAKKIQCHLKGLESLRIKETDRIQALQNELAKIGATLEEKNGEWLLTPSNDDLPDLIKVETYDDHRMAMAFAPLATKMNVEIADGDVVAKSYPTFWDHMKQAGFTIS